ncbi:hypothetical protein [Klebsiella quasipneumoniae]|uniref:hypothetical protein n=3 Tax=Klebsiella quasipneumoniae TaxID=1463165 RepID=UPI002169037F|nr:hypothetical protein [Klebsiella quasipneumoniae]MCS4411996.1 hypothetical protein [Klebsiella quasipneumoniae subsp. similipneumoniae]
MKKQLALFNNNLVNKYDYSFSIKSLSTQLIEHYSWESGIPNFINHDMHRPLSWSRIHGLSIDNTKVGLLGEISIPETKKEKSLIHNLTQDYLEKTVFNITHEDKDKLKTLIGESVYSENIKFIRGECITAFDTNIALKKFPELFGNYENDKRSLVDLSTLDCIAPGIFSYNGLLVFAHRYFRRSLSPLNNLNTPLLKQLQTLSSDKDLEVKILLDPHSLGLPGSYLEPIELDYWWGPKFDDSLKDISNGVATHVTSKEESFFNGISKTEFWWHDQNGIKSLECEETRDIPSAEMLELGNSYGFRYAHSMLTNEGIPNHLDGAIRLYDEDGFLSRLDTSIDKAGKNAHYFKIWRIDGNISVSTWKRILSDYYKDNRLIGEYFEGEDSKSENITSNKKEFLTKEKKYVYTPSKEQGPSIYISIKDKDENIQHDVIIHTEDLITDYFELNNTIDLKFIGLQKQLINRFNSNLKIPNECIIIAYEDMNFRIPEVAFYGEDSVTNAIEYLGIVQSYIPKLPLIKESTITFAISVEYESFILKISCITNSKDFLDLLSHNDLIPTSHIDIHDWVSRTQQNIININNKNCEPQTLLLRNKKIHIPLVMLNEHEVIIDGNNLVVKFHKSNIDNVTGMELNYKPVMLNAVKNATCAKCNISFFDCKCIHSKLIMDKINPLGIYWSETTSFPDEVLNPPASSGDKVAIEMVNKE